MESPIYIQKFTANDFDQYFDLVCNEQVMAMITERAIPLNEAQRDYAALLFNNCIHPVFGNYKIYEQQTKRFIGLAKLEIKTIDSVEAELGYMLLPQFWGKGLGTAVTQLMMSKAMEQPHLKKVIAIIDPTNIPSRKILINNGFLSEKLCDFDGLPGEILSRIL